MPPGSWDDQSLFAYLLGELPGELSAQLENQYFRDDELFSKVCSVEHELLDRYLRGELTGERRERFETQYVSAPARRQTLDAEREWFEAAKMARSQVPRGISALLPRWLRRFFMSEGPTLRFVAVGLPAAAVLLSCWLVYRTASLGKEAQRLRTELAARTASVQPFASFILVPGVERDAGAPKRLSIPAGAVRVVLHLQLEGVARYDAYRATIRAVGGPEVWSGATTIAEATATAEVPALALTRNDYTLTLDGIRQGGTSEKAATYVFGVVSR